jgi:hypothetical protein
MQASFITLAMSIASTAAMSLGLAPNPQTQKTSVDLDMARFNIDLLEILKEKTKGNLAKEEEDFMTNVTRDLKLKYVEMSKK